MRWYMFVLSLVLFSSPLSAGGPEQSVALWKDQKHKEAFADFLETLRSSEKNIQQQKESDLYLEALVLYNDPTISSREKALKIKEKYLSLQKENPGDSGLAYIVASAHANLEHYDRFFNLFHHAYQLQPNHFIAEKTKAILHIKLLERSVTQEDREAQRPHITKHLERTIDLHPKDISLYRMILTFAPANEKPRLIHKCLTVILDKKIVVQRRDIAFLVREAAEQGEFSLAERFIEEASLHYGYSRSLIASSRYLENKRKH